MKAKRKATIWKSTDLVENTNGWPELIFWIIVFILVFSFLGSVFIFPPAG